MQKLFQSKTHNVYQSIRKQTENEHILPELSFMTGYLTVCVSIIELQINYKISFKQAV